MAQKNILIQLHLFFFPSVLFVTCRGGETQMNLRNCDCWHTVHASVQEIILERPQNFEGINTEKKKMIIKGEILSSLKIHLIPMPFSACLNVSIISIMMHIFMYLFTKNYILPFSPTKTLAIALNISYNSF